MMDQDQVKIDTEYKEFMIPERYIPNYEDPNSFALGFKKFSLLKEVNTVYSDTSILRKE